jgi:hypothetical protein
MPGNTNGSEEQPVAGLVDKAKEVAGTVAEKAGPAGEKAKESAIDLIDKAKERLGNKDDGT